ncbi:hypothetical protein ACSQ67_011372 [Phaseolus vulgaris]
MRSHEDDLDLLHSFHDRVPDDELLNQREKLDMSVFINVIQDFLPYDPFEAPKPTNKPVIMIPSLKTFLVFALGLIRFIFISPIHYYHMHAYK